MVKTLSELYLDARKALLKQEDPQSASLYARNLLCHVTGKTVEKVITDGNEPAPEGATFAMEQAVNRLLAGEPLAYVLEEWDFYGMRLHVDKNVLIPRDDTCAVAELAINQALFLEHNPRILDLCTGSGCIGLAIAARVKDVSFEYPGSVGAGPRQVATEQGPQEAILKELSRHEPRNQAISMELNSDESCCSTGNNQARDQAGITQLSWQLSSR